MRIDVMTVFPEFFGVLDVSLVGKARARGLIDIEVHDVRDWATDVHRTVDDTPFGGGAGMVMKPDIWGAALDDVRARSGIAGQCVLAIPTPSGHPLTQQRCYELAQADHMIIACGRYEGIDSRVAEYYASQPDVVVYEYSLGDYVLNGGEVAATALIEAVGRLVPGMVGNPESLVEESHGEAGLLEYPVYTRPAEFRGIEVPEVLTSGNHQAVARWRRDRALEKTAVRRPDMIERVSNLDKKDCALLAQYGWIRPRKTDGPVKQVTVRLAGEADVEALTELARRTFPDGLDRNVSETDVQMHITQHVNKENVRSWITNGAQLVLVAELEREIIGFSHAMWDTQITHHLGAPQASDLVYVAGIYLDRLWRGSGLYGLLMTETFKKLRDCSAVPNHADVWTAVANANRRAQKALKKSGFVSFGERTGNVGDANNSEVTLVRPLNLAE
ncbi:tRNA (guanosine(37)-N1)-methyltransferase TrmD [Arcanobacterium phocae]|uniref:tRNA (guanosine(37)-N1)-methyltransferase TrmD n=1 Tax=Arcanobacterium phocae TaxID=131112 RepID=UPI001C0F0C95|nr:tRNA (guanosine(37)-N1)-methyltransferase TrmD [Arcanobacterium phocae]